MRFTHPVEPEWCFGLNVKDMFGTKKNKEEHRYYLLPGMGRSNRRFHRISVHAAIVVGILCSLLFGFLLYMLNKRY